MGEKSDVLQVEDSEQLRLFMKSLLQDVRALETMLDRGLFETGIRRIGAEQELALVDRSWHPAPLSMPILEELDDPAFTTELGKFNIEFNLEPIVFSTHCLSTMQKRIDELLTKLREVAARHHADAALTGILPSLHKSDLGLHNMTDLPRYGALNDALNKLRGGPYELRIMGTDELNVRHETVMLEACNTSFQVHFQTDPAEFARMYNIAQAVSGFVLSAATNSPLLFGRRLWRETRIALFLQSLDTRQVSTHVRDTSPRVSFGNRWVDNSVLEIFREDIARFRVLIGTGDHPDPVPYLERGEAPPLKALLLHNSTVYRWNRPCYGTKDGVAHLRIENRYLPAGPTPADEVANAALWFGLMSAIANDTRDIRERIAFDDVKSNFLAAARQGLDAQLVDLDGRTRPARDLLLSEILPLARTGLEQADLAPEDIDRYMGILTERVDSTRTGSSWLLRSFTNLKRTAGIDDRLGALTAAMVAQERRGRPVHEWDLAEPGSQHETILSRITRVEQIMTTDLFTVNQDELIDLVANVMDWQHIRHVPVEDNDHRLVGLVTHRSLLRVLGRGMLEGKNRTLPVSAIMHTDLITVPPEESTRRAIEIMRSNRIACLPVVRHGKLVGIVTERDFLQIAARLIDRVFDSEDAAVGEIPPKQE